MELYPLSVPSSHSFLPAIVVLFAFYFAATASRASEIDRYTRIMDNAPPVITGQASLAVSVNDSFLLVLSEFSFTDDDTAPDGSFTLRVLPGTDYLQSGNTVTPANNFSGWLSVWVVINDGISDSEPFAALIAILPIDVNELVITDQRRISIEEDTEYPVSLADIIFVATNGLGEPVILQLLGGANYKLMGNSVVPDRDFNGTLTIPLHIYNGYGMSNTYDLTIEVLPVNDAPLVLSSQGFTVENGMALTFFLSDFVIMDPDNSSQDLLIIILTGEGFEVQGNSILVDEGTNGVLRVGIQVSDGILSSEVFVVDVNVLSVTGMKESLPGSIQLYPNPAQEYVTITYASADITAVTLISMDGQVLDLRVVGNSDRIVIPVGHLSEGSYVLKLRIKKNRVVQQKLLVTR